MMATLTNEMMPPHQQHITVAVQQPQSQQQQCAQVRVHKDSAQNLDELFRVAKNQISVSKPMRMRDLPASFFTPPETGTKSASHSRESSIDQQAKRPYFKVIPSTGSTNHLENQHNNIINNLNSITQQNGTGHVVGVHQKLLLNRTAGIPIHSRAHSSPASLQKTLSVTPQINQNIINQQTVQQTVQQTQQQINQNVQAQNAVQKLNPISQQNVQHIRQLSDINQIPLPDGWQEAIEHTTGRTYFINHNEKTTTWDDPRPAIQMMILQQQQQMQALVQQQQFQQQPTAQPPQQPPQPQPQQQVIQPQQLPTVNNIIMSTNDSSKLPDGYEQKKTENGEIYFINHNDRTSSWFDPRIPIQLQKQTINRPPPVIQQNSEQPQIQQQQSSPTQIIQQNPQIIQSQQQTEHNLIQQQQQQQQQQTIPPQQQQTVVRQDDFYSRIQRLQFERDSLRQKQLEIMNNANGMATDPFLGGCAAGSAVALTAIENHTRQESADSGFSGLGSNYSLPNTPEDMLDSDVLNDCNNFVHESLGLDSLAISEMELDENMDHDLLPNLADDCQDINLPDLENWIIN